MLPCPRCATPAPTELLSCPHCNAALSSTSGPELRALPLIFLSLGLSLAGCGDKEEDSADTGDTIAQPEYGTAAITVDDSETP